MATPSMARGSLATPGHRGGGHRNPLYIFYRKCMLLKIVGGGPRPLRRPGVRWPPPRWPGVANEPLAVEGVAIETPPSIQSEQPKSKSKRERSKDVYFSLD